LSAILPYTKSVELAPVTVLTTYDAVDTDPIKVPAVKAKLALLANDAVPNKDPVNDVAVTALVTDNDAKAASEPDVMTFFQFGINIQLVRLHTLWYAHFSYETIVYINMAMTNINKSPLLGFCFIFYKFFFRGISIKYFLQAFCFGLLTFVC